MQIKGSSTSQNVLLSRSSGSFASRLEPSSKDKVVGLDEDLMKIKGRLCGEQSNLQIIPIVGMGGIGKTTLARYAHDDPSSVHHFDVRAWVTASQNSELRRILLGLVHSIDGFYTKKHQNMDNELLVQHGYRYLKGRRYLIVMDDMWDTNVWDDVRRMFPDDLNGSRVVITTRELDVASYVDPSIRPHRMHLMAVDQSWRLLKLKVFGQENCPHELEKTGKLIAENCRGLPLAIVVIAGVLSKVNQMQDTWMHIAENVNEAVNTSDEPFAEILSLSYTHLPHHLRSCFLYMGGFPEDQEITVSKLMRLWAAEGFLQTSGSKYPEEVGEDYLADLAKRSLILIDKKRYNGKIKTIKMHHLLRELCLRKARDDKFLLIINEFSGSFPAGIQNTRCLSIFSDISGNFPNMEGSSIQTILFFHHWAFDSWTSFRLLRILDALTSILRSYPLEIVELIHLRYLAFTFTPRNAIRTTQSFLIPGSLSKLVNLQTLIIRQLGFSRFTFTSSLPIEIWRMPQLRHLILLDGFLPDPSHGQILALKDLHTLTRIKCFTCSGRILEMIPNLKKLSILYSFRDIYETEWSMYGLNNLVHLHKLEKLNFYADPHDYSQSNLSKNLAFPVTLKRLTLSGSGIPWKDMSIVGSLPNLECSN